MMRQFTRGERAKLAELAAINHIWEVGVSIDAPFFVVDFCCLGLDASGQVVDDRYLISYNQPDAPQDAISLDNTSNNGAIFTLNLGRLPQEVRRLVFTATLNEAPMPGGILGAAFSLFGPAPDIGEGHLTLSTPAIDSGFFNFSGEDFGEESTLILGELYWRDEWRFVVAGQPLKGELSTFLRSLTEGPTAAPSPTPVPQRAAAPSARASVAAPKVAPRIAAPQRQPKIPAVSAPAAVTAAPAVLTAAPSAPIAASVAAAVPTAVRAAVAISPAPVQPAAQPIAAPAASATASSAAPLFPQSLAPGVRLQDLIDAAAPGSTLTLMRDEYEGPITISKPLTLEGRDSALWAKVGPVVTIAAANVALRNLEVEITVALDASDETGVALKVETQAPQLQLDNVRVRGRISGLGAEDGEWALPSLLDLGQFAPRADNEFRFSLNVPTQVQLSSPVEGVSLFPMEVGAGNHQITLRVSDVVPETLIVGFVEVRSAAVVRKISLSGSAVVGVAPKLSVEI